MHENCKILQLHHFNLDASWSTDCRLTQREICTSFLLDVATLQRCHVVTLRRLLPQLPKKSSYICKKILKYCNYTILIWTPPSRQNVDWTYVRFVTLSCSVLLRCDVAALWRCSEFISTMVKSRYTPVYQCPNAGAGCLRRQPWLHTAALLKLCGVCWYYLPKYTTTNLRSLHTYAWKW